MTLSGDQTTQLRQYTLAKQQVSACVRALKQLLEAPHPAERDELPRRSKRCCPAPKHARRVGCCRRLKPSRYANF